MLFVHCGKASESLPTAGCGSVKGVIPTKRTGEFVLYLWARPYQFQVPSLIGTGIPPLWLEEEVAFKAVPSPIEHVRIE